jgi:hypothetical protein
MLSGSFLLRVSGRKDVVIVARIATDPSTMYGYF